MLSSLFIVFFFASCFNFSFFSFLFFLCPQFFLLCFFLQSFSLLLCFAYSPYSFSIFLSSFIYISFNICFRNSFSSFISHARSVLVTRLLPFVPTYFPTTKTSRYLNNVAGISQGRAEAKASQASKELNISKANTGRILTLIPAFPLIKEPKNLHSFLHVCNFLPSLVLSYIHNTFCCFFF